MNKETDIARAQQLLHESDLRLGTIGTGKEFFVDANGNDFPDRREKMIELEKNILADYEAVLNHSNSFWTRLRAFLSASSKAGRYAKAIKDFGLLLFPWGQKVSSVSEFITERFIKPNQQTDGPMKDIFKRAFTKKNGGFWKLLSQFDNKDWQFYAAFILRAATIIGILYAADYLGLPIDRVITAIIGA